MQLKRFLEIIESLFFSLALTRDINFVTLCHDPVTLAHERRCKCLLYHCLISLAQE